MLSGVIKKTIQILLLLAILIFIIYLVFYFGAKDYLDGELHHYSGSSEITSEQVAILGSELTIGGRYGDLDHLEILENGNVKVDYDFYSEDSYSFLNTSEISYFDSPVVNTFLKQKVQWLILLGVFIAVVIIWRLAGKINLPDGAERKAVHAAWYLIHPKYLVKHQEAKGLYSSQIAQDINVSLNDIGIVCTRTWKYKNGYLYSAGIGQACWETKTLFANKNPDEDNKNGVYASRLGVIKYDWEFIKEIIGIVSLKGEWYEHADGVIRAERCDILHLIVSEYFRPIADKLSSVYGVPVTIADNCLNKYLNWLLKENGLACMIHNSKIMEATYGNKGTGC